MSDLDLYANVGRNDPCPCGSGKKYKKCHFRKNQIAKQIRAESPPLNQFIKAGQIPYVWFKGLRTIINRRDWALYYEALQEDSAIHKQYPSREAFIEFARTQHTDVPAAGDDFELRRVHITDDERAFLMGARGIDDRHSNTITFEVLEIVNTRDGYRLASCERQEIAKVDAMDDDPAFETFANVQAAFAANLEREVKDPDLVRWVYAPEKVHHVVEEESEEAQEAVEVAE